MNSFIKQLYYCCYMLFCYGIFDFVVSKLQQSCDFVTYHDHLKWNVVNTWHIYWILVIFCIIYMLCDLVIWIVECKLDSVLYNSIFIFQRRWLVGGWEWERRERQCPLHIPQGEFLCLPQYFEYVLIYTLIWLLCLVDILYLSVNLYICIVTVMNIINIDELK